MKHMRSRWWIVFMVMVSGMAWADPVVRIPGGLYQRGNVTGDSDITDAPVQRVWVSEFYLQANLVTKARWDEVRTWGLANGYTDLFEGAGKASNHPVQSVNWYDVVKWANAASEKAGLTPCYKVGGEVFRRGTSDFVVCDWSVNGYRLPTELEWEVAARGGLVGKRFPWGDTVTHGQANYFSSSNFSYDVSPTRGYHPAYAAGGAPYTSPVGSFPANGYGLNDMGGNVWQWCWDWYGSYSATMNTRGPAHGIYRVLRGGHWGDYARIARSARRHRFVPTDKYNVYGFRLALSRVSANPDAMLRIPAGTYQRGNVTGDSDIPDAPVQSVRVSEFYMQANLVTKARWDEVRTWGLANGYTDLVAGSGKASNHPVNRVTWYDVVKWSNAASEKDGLTPCYKVGGKVYRRQSDLNGAVVCDWIANGYRLPTELEWEVAARGGLVGKRFPWGDTITHSQANFYSYARFSYNLNQTHGFHPAYAVGMAPYTSPVGSFPANGYGLNDMAGNVWQWCWDWYGTYSATADTRGPADSGRLLLRVLRGGSWHHDASAARSAKRDYLTIGHGNEFNNIGFRLTRGRP